MKWGIARPILISRAGHNCLASLRQPPPPPAAAAATAMRAVFMPHGAGVAVQQAHRVLMCTATRATQRPITFSGFMILWRRPTSKQSCGQGGKMADAGPMSWPVSPAHARPQTLLLKLQQAAVRPQPQPAGSLLGSCTGRATIQSKTSSQLLTTPAACLEELAGLHSIRVHSKANRQLSKTPQLPNPPG